MRQHIIGMIRDNTFFFSLEIETNDVN